MVQNHICIVADKNTSINHDIFLLSLYGRDSMFYLNDALEIAQLGWNSDIYFWPPKYPHNITIPTSPDM
jgi:hypothetical protein